MPLHTSLADIPFSGSACGHAPFRDQAMAIAEAALSALSGGDVSPATLRACLDKVGAQARAMLPRVAAQASRWARSVPVLQPPRAPRRRSPAQTSRTCFSSPLTPSSHQCLFVPCGVVRSVWCWPTPAPWPPRPCSSASGLQWMPWADPTKPPWTWRPRALLSGRRTPCESACSRRG